MTERFSLLRDLPPMFLIGVLLNWAGVGVLALKNHPIFASAGLLAAGTLMMFVGAYTHRPEAAKGSPASHEAAPLKRPRK